MREGTWMNETTKTFRITISMIWGFISSLAISLSGDFSPHATVFGMLKDEANG